MGGVPKDGSSFVVVVQLLALVGSGFIEEEGAVAEGRVVTPRFQEGGHRSGGRMGEPGVQLSWWPSRGC